MSRPILALMAASLVLAANAARDEHAIETYHALQALANAGDAGAMYELATRLQHGDGIVRDLAQAIYWYEQSAAHCPDRDCAERAERAQGEIEDPSAFTRDDIAAYEAWAQAGDTGAMRELANQYRHGINIDKDESKTRHWLEAQVAAGDAGARIVLARDLEPAAAIALLNEAGDDPAALHALGVLHDKAGDYAKARELYEKASALGEKNATVDLAALYAHDHGVAQDYHKTRQLLESADTRKAHFNLAILYDAGFGVARDLAKARAYYEKATDHAERYENEAILYGAGADPYIALAEFALAALASEAGDKRQAFDWYTRSASKGLPSAQYNLATLFRDAGDNASARYWLEQAARRGHANAAHKLGVIYQDGLGVAQNPAIAKRYLALARRLEGCSGGQPVFLVHNERGECAAIVGEKTPAEP